MVVEAAAISSDAAMVIKMVINEFANHSNGRKMKKLDQVFTNLRKKVTDIPEDFYEFHSTRRWSVIRANTNKLFELYDALVDWQERMNPIQRFLSYRSTREKIKVIQNNALTISRQIKEANYDSRQTQSTLQFLKEAVAANEATLRGEMTGHETKQFEISSLERKLEMQNPAFQLADLAMDEEIAQDEIEHKRARAQIAREVTTRRFGDLFSAGSSNQTAARKEEEVEVVMTYLKEQEEQTDKASEKLYIPPRHSGDGSSSGSPLDIIVNIDEQSADEDPTTPTTLASFMTAQDWSISIDL